MKLNSLERRPRGGDRKAMFRLLTSGGWVEYQLYIWQCIKKLHNGSCTAKDSNSHGWLNKYSRYRLMEKTTLFIECKQWLDSVVIQKVCSVWEFLVQEIRLSALTLRARQYIAITPQFSLTAVKETLLETFLSLLNPHPRTETPPHHVLPVLMTVYL